MMCLHLENCYLNRVCHFAPSHSLQGHSRGPDKIRLNEDGRRCVTYDSTGRDTLLWLWDVGSGERRRMLAL